MEKYQWIIIVALVVAGAFLVTYEKPENYETTSQEFSAPLANHAELQAITAYAMQDGSSISRSFDSTLVQPGQQVQVTLNVDIGMDPHTYFVIEEYVPEGFTIIDGAGGESVSNVLRWCIFGTSQLSDASYTYTIQAPILPGNFQFHGSYVIDGMDTETEIEGVSTLSVQNITEEICDGIDNDLDGQIDEVCDCIHGSTRACGIDTGICTTGIEYCVLGYWSGECQNSIGPSEEICDGLDNDCDGRTDEDMGSTSCGLGTCIHTVQNCISGTLQTCNPFLGAQQEICEGSVDEDCDGTVDEGCICTNGQTDTCGIDVGSCTYGYRICSNGAWGEDCLGAVLPSAEICDGIDNDCDNQTDEGLGTTTCGIGICLHTIENCVAGQSQSCNPFEGATAERCDGIDNDCDGNTDEGCECIDGASRPCGSNAGACVAGVNICQNGIWSTSCIGEVGPVDEICDGLDNDCDSVVDEGFGTETCGIGLCYHTSNVCVNGALQTCNPFLGAQQETCDGIDNDCDGTTDEGCECINGETRPCGSSVGECSEGSEICVEGKWSSICTGATEPSSEICDGLDNDCDGIADENLGTTTCGQGICTHTIDNCVNGARQQCDPMLGAADEVCEGSIDEDCDGFVDNGCLCTTDQTRVCGISTGACTQGTETCLAGQWSGVCEGAIYPASEVCDGIDNDCDGQADENLGTTTCGQGACTHTVTNCIGGKTQSCDPYSGATAETCDGIDNDCDGMTDEGCLCINGEERSCGTDIGACIAGYELCEAGSWTGTCVGEVRPKSEVCDGADNDCDGIVDEDMGTVTCGLGACTHTIDLCVDGILQSCNPYEGVSSERCDGKDNDCDGIIDEGCACREKWACEPWSTCDEDGYQYRTCYDKNMCGTEVNKPDEVRECHVSPGLLKKISKTLSNLFTG